MKIASAIVLVVAVLIASIVLMVQKHQMNDAELASTSKAIPTEVDSTPSDELLAEVEPPKYKLIPVPISREEADAYSIEDYDEYERAYFAALDDDTLNKLIVHYAAAAHESADRFYREWWQLSGRMTGDSSAILAIALDPQNSEDTFELMLAHINESMYKADDTRRLAILMFKEQIGLASDYDDLLESVRADDPQKVESAREDAGYLIKEYENLRKLYVTKMGILGSGQNKKSPKISPLRPPPVGLAVATGKAIAYRTS